jgi:hypothetical protein
MPDELKPIPPQGVIRIPEALGRLLELYMVTNTPEAKYPSATK